VNEEAINPIDELKRAIASGKMNKRGLAFLRDTFVKHQPKLIPLIDRFLNDPQAPCADGLENKDINQSTIFKGRNEK